MSLWNRSRDFWRTCGPPIVPLHEMFWDVEKIGKNKSFIHTSFCPNGLFVWGVSVYVNSHLGTPTCTPQKLRRAHLCGLPSNPRALVGLKWCSLR